MNAAQMLDRGQKQAAELDAALHGFVDADAMLDSLIRLCEALPLHAVPTTSGERSLKWLLGAQGYRQHAAGMEAQHTKWQDCIGGAANGMLGSMQGRQNDAFQRQFAQAALTQGDKGLQLLEALGLTHDAQGEPWK